MADKNNIYSYQWLDCCDTRRTSTGLDGSATARAAWGSLQYSHVQVKIVTYGYLATCRLPLPYCSHIWWGTKCSPKFVQGTDDSALAVWAAHSQCGTAGPADASPD